MERPAPTLKTTAQVREALQTKYTARLKRSTGTTTSPGPMRSERLLIRAQVLTPVIGGVNVQIIEPGYEGAIEFVHFTQIVRIEGLSQN